MTPPMLRSKLYYITLHWPGSPGLASP